VNDSLFLEVFDEDEGESDDLIGFISVKVSSFLLNAHRPEGNDDWHSIFYNNEKVGSVHTLSHFVGEIAYQKHVKTTE